MGGQDDVRVVWDGGVHLEGTPLWFDPRRAREFCAITNARAPISDRQTRLLQGDKTARLTALRHGRRAAGLVTPFGRAFSMGNLDIELFPSGYMPGGSQVQVTVSGSTTVVYTGPISMRRSRTAERIEVRRGDVLILDATYGHERYRLPDRDAVYGEILEWTSKTLSGGYTPIFLASNPGKAQDLIHVLGANDFALRVHRNVYAWNKAYLGIGIDVPGCKQFRGHPAHGEVMIWPAHLRKSRAIRNLRRTRFAATTGRALDRGTARRLRVNEVFGWSGRADYDDLLDYVKKARPGRVVTVGRHAVDFAATLAQRGVRAEALPDQPQLALL